MWCCVRNGSQIATVVSSRAAIVETTLVVCVCEHDTCVFCLLCCGDKPVGHADGDWLVLCCRSLSHTVKCVCVCACAVYGNNGSLMATAGAALLSIFEPLAEDVCACVVTCVLWLGTRVHREWRQLAGSHAVI
jgi:hypothetical protein